MRNRKIAVRILFICSFFLVACSELNEHPFSAHTEDQSIQEPARLEEDYSAPACDEAMKSAAAVIGRNSHDTAITKTLSECRSANEWMETLKKYPEAMGVTSAEFISDEDLILVCWDHQETHVCRDAVATERMPALESAGDDHTIQIMFQWMPEYPDAQPAEANYILTVFGEDESTEELYATPVNSLDPMPSMDTDDFYVQTFQVPEGGHVSAMSTLKTQPNTGRMSCLVLDMDEKKVLDYQEGEVNPTEPLHCWGFTHDNHGYTPGSPPVEVLFD